MNNHAILHNFWQQALYNFLPDAIEFLCLIVSGLILLRAAWLLKKNTQVKGANLMFFSLVIMGVMLLLSMILPILLDMNENNFGYLIGLSIPFSMLSAIGFYRVLIDTVKRHKHEY